MIGRTLSHYEILEKLGEGGMGVVYRARDTRLGRTVAIKVLRPETVGDPERKWRFEREAKAASALNHPHIVTIHDIDSADGIDFIVMEWIAGASLDRWTASGPLPLERALAYAIQAASALGAAHAAGIVHRDVKPANLIVTESGSLKVLDFGLAKLVEREEDDGGVAPSATPTAPLGDPRTRQGVILGTLSYMSPEQAEGKPVDERSDVFSLGVVLWEMLAGRRAFDGTSHLSILTAILRDQPPALRSLRSDVPAPVEAIIARCLDKDPERRYSSGADLARELASAREELVSPPARTGALLRRPAFLIPAALVVLALAGAAVLLARRNARERWAREVAMPEIARLVEVEDFVPALHLARRAERAIPQDPELARLVKNSATTVSVDTRPPGAEVFFASYLRPESGWERLGKTPIEMAHVPLGALRWRVERPGFTTLEAGAAGQPGRGPALIHLQFTLTPDGSGPPGMVRVPGGGFQYRFASPVRLEDYWLDQFEVTNGQFKAFVDGGGYEKRGLWRHAFTREGREISWDDAMRGFRDPTGRPGPATWELGTYPAGRQDYPVSGVSWYEAAAFCELAGKNLPTFHHWYRAADLAVFSQILRLSNFSGEGPARVGEHRGVGPFGTYDMAGNVKEWCWNEASGKRYILGGAWSDASYLYSESEQALPMQRRPEFGFRCAQYTQPLGDELAAPIERTWRDYSKEKPVSDDVFRIYAGLYAHDPAELAARVESVDDSAEHWRRETISFNAAYGGERVLARLFLPKSAAPPFQTVVYFPDSTAEVLPSSDDLNMRWFDFVMRSGRALLLPIYKGTYERSTDAPQTSPNARRDVLIQWVKDLRRSIDYLETRGDIDRDRLAFYGFSLGAVYGPIFAALEPRLKTCIIVGGGLPQRRMPPEADAINFAPRVKMPFLMVNGRQDFIRPLDVSLQPLLRSLGTPEKDKRLALLEGGHLPPKMAEVIREILDWLDRYLGAVRLKA